MKDEEGEGVVSLCVPEHARHIHKSLHLPGSRELTPVGVIERLAVGFTFALEAQQTPDEVGTAVAEGGPGQGHPLQAVAREARGCRGARGPEVGLGHVVVRQAGPHTASHGRGAGIPARPTRSFRVLL